MAQDDLLPNFKRKSLSSRLSLISDKSRVLAGEEFNLKADLLNEKSLPVKNQEITLKSLKTIKSPLLRN